MQYKNILREMCFTEKITRFGFQKAFSKRYIRKKVGHLIIGYNNYPTLKGTTIMK